MQAKECQILPLQIDIHPFPSKHHHSPSLVAYGYYLFLHLVLAQLLPFYRGETKMPVAAVPSRRDEDADLVKYKPAE